MSPSLILFDLDETLFDHMHASRSGLEALRERFSALRSIRIDRLESTAFGILERTHHRVLAGELSFADSRIERMRLLFEEVGQDAVDDDFADAAGIYAATYRRSRRAVDGACELLDRLRPGCVVGVVTNHFRTEQESKLADCGLADRVDFMVTSEETGSTKPDAEIFRTALELGGARASESVMVGDSWAMDIIGALNAGIRPVWFNRRRRPRPNASSVDDRLTVDEVHSFEPTEDVRSIILDW